MTQAVVSRVPANKWVIAGTVVLASFVVVMDVSIVNVAMPQMLGEFGVTLDSITWVAVAYSIAEIILVTMASWCSMLLGRKRYYILSFSIFTAASVLCGLAPSLEMMIAARVLQGLGGGGLIPVAQAIILAEDVTPVRRWSLACPALPSCGLALTEAERIQTPLIDQIEERLTRHGLLHERFSIRITGCPNGCARPYAGDIGLVGRMPGFFALYVGGDFAGTRLNEAIAERLDIAGIADALDPLFALFASSRAAGEGFGDFCHRIGIAALQQIVEGKKAA